MHAFAISKISFRSPLSSTQTPNGFRKYIRCDNELNRFMSVHSWVQLLDDTTFLSFVPFTWKPFCVSCLFSIEFVTRSGFFLLVFAENCNAVNVCIFFYLVRFRNNSNRYKRIVPHTHTHTLVSVHLITFLSFTFAALPAPMHP